MNIQNIMINLCLFLISTLKDWNHANSELSQFPCEYNASNIVKEIACFKSALNPSCIDPFITNTPLNFQNTTAISYSSTFWFP